MPEKLKTFIYIITPLFMIFLAWVIHVIVAHNVSSDQNTIRILNLALNAISFLIQGVVMAAIARCVLDNANIQMILSAGICIILFIIFFNISAVSFSFIPESVDDFLADYGYLSFIWSGIYCHNFIASYRRA